MICPSCNQNLTEKTNKCPKCGLIVPWAEEFTNELSFYKWTTDLYSIKLEQKEPTLPAISDYLHFGRDKNGKEISWKVLNIKNQTAFIISENIICSMPYHQPGGEITWSDCSLRKWLNNDFINVSFNQTERERIILHKVMNNNNPRYKTPGGILTTALMKLNNTLLLTQKELQVLCGGYGLRGLNLILPLLLTFLATFILMVILLTVALVFVLLCG